MEQTISSTVAVMGNERVAKAQCSWKREVGTRLRSSVSLDIKRHGAGCSCVGQTLIH